jgi:pyrroloquinoline quinone biosynthesis protein B
VAWLVTGPRRRLLWLPDIDRWETWDRKLADLAADPALAMFLDGTFYSADEIPGRSIRDIPHPLVPDTAAILTASGKPAAAVYFVHLNHTNRLFWDADAMSALEAKGLGVAREWQRLPL